MNLLTDPLLTVSGNRKVSLPDLFAAMARGEVRGFPAMRPHQRPAWHMFLVQLGALALWSAGRTTVSREPADWATILRGLTPDHADDSPWCLVVEEPARPAFLQPPDPGGLAWSPLATPDALDLLITSRNHDLKQAVARQASPEDWVFALVSLQTCEGQGGRKNYGIARMNGGFSSRPLLGLVSSNRGDVSVDPSRWWVRDVRRLLATAREGGVGVVGGPSLLWCLDWPEGQQIDLRDLDPWFIEVCRRVRLSQAGGRLFAVKSSSKASRIDAKAFRGNFGDPWAPIHNPEGKCFTLAERDFDYAMLCNLLFSGEYIVPLLAQHGSDETGDMILVAEAFSRGQGKTDGFKSRVIPVPGRVAPLLSSPTAATFSKAQMDEIKVFDVALRDAISIVSAGGSPEEVKKNRKKHSRRALPSQQRFDRAADRLFFPHLWNRIAANEMRDADAEGTAKIEFLEALRDAAEAELKSSLPAIPCPTIQRPRAEARAQRAFYARLRREHPLLFYKEDVDVAT